MKKMIRVILPCPYCNQKIRFNESRPKYDLNCNLETEKKATEEMFEKYKQYEEDLKKDLNPLTIQLLKQKLAGKDDMIKYHNQNIHHINLIHKSPRKRMVECPHKNCKKSIGMIVTDNSIELIKSPKDPLEAGFRVSLNSLFSEKFAEQKVSRIEQQQKEEDKASA